VCVGVCVCLSVVVVVFVCALVVTLLLGCTDLTEKYNLMLGGDNMVVSRAHTLTPSNSRMPLPEVLMSGSVFKSSTRSLTSSSD
jgi:hypothetical protein